MRTSVRRGVTSAALGMTLGLLAVPARADTTVTVPGTSFPSDTTYLTRFGCESLYRADTSDPLVRVVLDDSAPLGRRAASLDLPGEGTATGPVSLVTSVATATHHVSVRAAAGASGVAWVWYVAPDLTPGEVWAGRADLVAGADGWQRLDPAAASYDWTRLEAATGAVRETAPGATLTDFTGEHGDGPGYLLSGMGCDGTEFALDDVSVGIPGDVTTYDLEGSPVSTSLTASAERVAAGEQVTLTGVTVDSAGRSLGASLVLQARPQGDARFTTVGEPLLADPSGAVVTTVAPESSTDYRWFFAERSYADAHASPVVRVAVQPGRR